MLWLLPTLACLDTSDTLLRSEPVDSQARHDTGDTASTDTDGTRETAVDSHDSGGDSSQDTATEPETGGPLDTSPPAWCPDFGEPVELGIVTHEDLKELSGVVESRRHPGLLWTHNDSGDTDRFFAISRTGELLGTWSIEGVLPRDLEDLAIGPGPDGEPNYLYLGDVGDNNRVRDELRVLRLPEPQVQTDAPEPLNEAVTPEVIELFFQDGIPRDSEAIFVDPLTGDIYLVIKDRDGLGISGIFRAAAPFGSEAPAPLVEVAELIFGGDALPGSDLATGADISEDGEWIVIRTYSSLFLWWRNPEKTLWQAFEHNACPSPLAHEPQGEAVGFAANGRDYLTVSEKLDQPVWLYSWGE